MFMPRYDPLVIDPDDDAVDDADVDAVEDEEEVDGTGFPLDAAALRNAAMEALTNRCNAATSFVNA